MEKINASDAVQVLEDMLFKEGFKKDKPNIELAWNIFKQFSEIPVECSDDALLFECGVYGFTGEDLYNWSLVRQFIFEDEDEYDHMEQLHFTVFFEPSEELKKMATNMWTYDCDTWDEFFMKAEELEGFKIPQDKYLAIKSEIYQERV